MKGLLVVSAGVLLVAGLALGAAPAAAAPEDFVEACSNGIAVPDPEDNPGLVQDCAVLLSVRGTLAGDALAWSADMSIRTWYGVVVESGRVIGLRPLGKDLKGSIPPELGNLSQLRSLLLTGNSLTGSIPPELARLTLLESLWLHGNHLTGPIPPEFGGMPRLQSLLLGDNSLTGPIPRELARLSTLRDLWLHGNDLTGPIPSQLGALRNLEQLTLSGNNLTGSIPPELADLPNLRVLWLVGNEFSGCLPAGLRDIGANLQELNLPDCPDPGPGKSGTGLAPRPSGPLAAALNVVAVVATVVAVLGIAAGLRTRYRP